MPALVGRAPPKHRCGDSGLQLTSERSRYLEKEHHPRCLNHHTCRQAARASQAQPQSLSTVPIIQDRARKLAAAQNTPATCRRRSRVLNRNSRTRLTTNAPLAGVPAQTLRRHCHATVTGTRQRRNRDTACSHKRKPARVQACDTRWSTLAKGAKAAE